MKLTKRVLLPVLVLLIPVLLGCTKKATKEIDFGMFDGNSYHNDYFDMTINLPGEWSVQDSESTRRLKETGQKMLAGDDKQLKAIVKASDLLSVTLFVVFEHPLGTPVPFNLNVIGVAEKVSHLPGLKGGQDYLYHARKLLESAQVNYSFPKEPFSKTLGGKTFDAMYTETVMHGLTVKQEYYATIMKGYALSFIITFTDETGRTTLLNVLETLKFN